MMNGKIAYIVTAKHGLEAFVYTEITALKKLGCDISLYTTKFGKGPYMPESDWQTNKISILGVIIAQTPTILTNLKKYLKCLEESIRMGTITDFLIGAFYARIMKKENIEHIHCHMGDRKLFVGYYAHQLTGIPLTVIVHAHEMIGSAPKPDGRMFRLALASCEKIFTISEYNKKCLIKHHGILQDKIQVVRLFTGKDAVEKRISRKKLLMVANQVPKKGHRFLLEALKSLERSDWELWVVGGKVDLGPRTIDVAAIVSQMGLDKQVSFLGRVSDDALAALYQACDIFCLPSITERDGNDVILDQEGIPEVLKEAMTYGKPVVSTLHTGIPELVDEVLVEENDVQGLSKAIEGLLDSEEKRRELGARNREKIDRMYTNKDLKVLMRTFAHE